MGFEPIGEKGSRVNLQPSNRLAETLHSTPIEGSSQHAPLLLWSSAPPTMEGSRIVFSLLTVVCTLAVQGALCQQELSRGIHSTKGSVLVSRFLDWFSLDVLSPI